MSEAWAEMIGESGRFLWKVPDVKEDGFSWADFKKNVGKIREFWPRDIQILQSKPLRLSLETIFGRGGKNPWTAESVWIFKWECRYPNRIIGKKSQTDVVSGMKLDNGFSKNYFIVS